MILYGQKPNRAAALNRMHHSHPSLLANNLLATMPMNTLLSGSCRKFGHLILVLGLLISQAAFSDVIPSNRRTVWQGNVGVPGGIPVNRTVYTTIPAGASAATIQTALNSCPSNQIVQLSAGTYNLSSELDITRNGVTLRGAGPDKTTIISSANTAILIYGYGWYGEWATPNVNRHKSWVGGYTQGTNVITVSSTGDLAVGQIIFLDQLNDAGTSAIGSGGMADPGAYTSVAYPNSGQDRYQFQLTRVTAINGNNITISPAVFMPNWQASLQPQIWWEAGTPVQASGVEDLKIIGSYQGVNMQAAYGCWVKNVFVTGTQYYINPMITVRCEVRHCRMDGPTSNDDYGIQVKASSALLVEDNIGNACGTYLMVNGGSGCVFGYNYGTNFGALSKGNWMSPGIFLHGGHPNMNLFEGNIAAGFYAENYWGSSAYNTVFRNRLTGIDEGSKATIGGDVQAVGVFATNRYQNIVGNVLGTAGVNTYYEITAADSANCHDTSRVYYIGCFNGWCNSVYDPPTYSTLLRICNWDSANNGIVSGGYQPTDLGASYYQASKPLWFGSLQWPPIDPANPAYSSSRTNIPAGYRFIFGIDPPSGKPANQPPVAVASASPTNGPAPLAISFSSTGSYDPEGVAVTYNWTFGDGTTSTAANPSHTYSAAGSYTAQLTVSDGVTATTSSSLLISVNAAGSNQPPVGVAAATPAAGRAPLTVAFTSAGSYDPEGAALTYSWSFGDGTTSTAANPSHTYQTSGVYTAQLTVSDGTNRVTANVLTITVANGAGGLVAAYGFEESSGAGVTDASGNGNNGTISGAATRAATGRFGKALSFDGTSALVTVNDSASLELTTAMTLEAWVYLTVTGPDWQSVVFKPIDASSISYVLQGVSQPSKAPSLGTSVGSANLLAPTALPTNAWSHLAATYDGATMTLYVNGQRVASRAQTGVMGTSTQALTIGGNSLFGAYWTGLIDEVRIYNRALTASEIQTDMNTPVVGTSTRPAPAPPQNLRVVSP
jgi:PKD repeat protein